MVVSPKLSTGTRRRASNPTPSSSTDMTTTEPGPAASVTVAFSAWECLSTFDRAPCITRYSALSCVWGRRPTKPLSSTWTLMPVRPENWRA